MTANKIIKILIIDNYDSFTYNLAHYFENLDCEVAVYRNDEIELDEIEPFDKIVLSPGPGLPKNAGLTMEIIKQYAGKKPILGICLGQQAIAEFFGARLKNLDKVYHGVASKIKIIDSNELLFNDLKKEFEVGRYHSWTVDSNNFPDILQITSIDENGEIMSIRHKFLDICAVQFHPESILTQNGLKILKNWIYKKPSN